MGLFSQDLAWQITLTFEPTFFQHRGPESSFWPVESKRKPVLDGALRAVFWRVPTGHGPGPPVRRARVANF